MKYDCVCARVSECVCLSLAVCVEKRARMFIYANVNGKYSKFSGRNSKENRDRKNKIRSRKYVVALFLLRRLSFDIPHMRNYCISIHFVNIV